MIRIAGPLYAKEDLGLELDNTVYALDASTVDLCLYVFPWALFRSTKSAVKLHPLLDLRGNIPTFIYISDGKLHGVNVLDILPPEAGAFYVMDRLYVDFSRLFTLQLAGDIFAPRQIQYPVPTPLFQIGMRLYPMRLKVRSTRQCFEYSRNMVVPRVFPEPLGIILRCDYR